MKKYTYYLSIASVIYIAVALLQTYILRQLVPGMFTNSTDPVSAEMANIITRLLLDAARYSGFAYWLYTEGADIFWSFATLIFGPQVLVLYYVIKHIHNK